MYQFKKGWKKKNPNPSDSLSRTNIWFWFILLNYVRWKKENSSPSETVPFPLKNTLDTGSKHTICRATVYEKHTHAPQVSWEKFCYPLTRRKGGGEHQAFLGSFWPMSGGSSDPKIWIHSIQIYSSSINFLFQAASSSVSVSPFSKEEGGVKLPEGDGGRRGQIYPHCSPGWMTGPQCPYYRSLEGMQVPQWPQGGVGTIFLILEISSNLGFL